MRVAKTSVGYTGGTGDIFTNCHLLVFACGYLRYHVLLLCKTSYEGEFASVHLQTSSFRLLDNYIGNWDKYILNLN